MARFARVVAPGVPHHITQRGNRRQPVFFRDSDYQDYLKLMKEWCDKLRVGVWAYCLMPNHVHLIAVPANRLSLARAIGEAHRRYTRLVNLREEWRGYLFQGRFASYPMDDRHLVHALRYVELNPVRAGLVAQPGDYRWSSARAHLGQTTDPLIQAGAVEERIGDWSEFLRQDLAPLEREIIERHLRTGRPLGDQGFVAELERRLRRPLFPQKPGPRPKGRRRGH
jgi:putative transposase